MTIFLYTGTPGSGKSLHMAKDITWAVRMGRPVIANFDVNTSRFRNGGESFTYMSNEDMTCEALETYAREYFKDHKFSEGAIKLYIDECQIRFNSRDWRNSGDWVKRFFTQHRKLGYDVILVCQHHEMLDKQIRAVIEYEVHHRKVNNVGLFGKIVGMLALNHAVCVAVTTWYGQKMRLGAEWFIGMTRDYRIYDTYKIFEG